MKYLVGPLSNIDEIRSKLIADLEHAAASGDVIEIEVKPAKNTRRLAQNNLQFQWYLDAESQGDMTAQEYRAYCKAWFGVPILIAEDEAFRAVYDSVIRPLDYEQKLELMAPPIDLPITSRMTVKQMSKYLDAVHAHFIGKGIQLTDTDQRRAG